MKMLNCTRTAVQFGAVLLAGMLLGAQIALRHQHGNTDPLSQTVQTPEHSVSPVNSDDHHTGDFFDSTVTASWPQYLFTVAVIGMTLVFELLVALLRYIGSRHRTVLVVVERLFGELATLGLLGFCLWVASNSLESRLDEEQIEALHTIHYYVFLLTVSYIFFLVLLVSVVSVIFSKWTRTNVTATLSQAETHLSTHQAASRRIRLAWWRHPRCASHASRTKYNFIFTSMRGLAMERLAIEHTLQVKEHVFGIRKEKPIDSSLPPNFDYAKYLRLAARHLIIHMSHFEWYQYIIAAAAVSIIMIINIKGMFYSTLEEITLFFFVPLVAILEIYFILRILSARKKCFSIASSQMDIFAEAKRKVQHVRNAEDARTLRSHLNDLIVVKDSKFNSALLSSSWLLYSCICVFLFAGAYSSVDLYSTIGLLTMIVINTTILVPKYMDYHVMTYHTLDVPMLHDYARAVQRSKLHNKKTQAMKYQTNWETKCDAIFDYYKNRVGIPFTIYEEAQWTSKTSLDIPIAPRASLRLDVEMTLFSRDS